MAIVDDDEDMMRKDNSLKCWWIDNCHSASPRSPWLRSTLSELDRKTKAMMKLIETEADSFAQRAEMYYKKRPELINMVQDFYKAQRSLVEKYDQLQSDNRSTRVLPHHHLLLSPTTSSSSSVSVDYYNERDGNNRSSTTRSLSSDHHHHDPFDCKSTISSGGIGDGVDHDQDQDEAYDDCRKFPSACNTHSELYDHEVVEDSDSAAESDVDDPDIEDEAISANKGFADAVESEYVKMLKVEVEELKEENRVQKEQLTQKDEEKREVIRQLSLAMEMLRAENMEARKLKKKKKKQQQQQKDVAEEEERRRNHQRRVPSELEKLKDSIFNKLWQVSPLSKARVTTV